jgi:hypothetical protein
MTDWTTAELDRVDGADELQITTARRDGSLHDEAYRAKYARYGSTYLRPMLAEQARAATLRLTPRD